jgi:hypothetical protein
MSSKPTFCTACAQGKIICIPVPKERTSALASNFGDKVHSDVWGPLDPESYNAKRYFVCFTDDKTRWSSLATMGLKSDTMKFL